MIYHSNISAPDLTPLFKHAHCRVMGHSRGHDVLSDFADRPAADPVFGLYKNCGFFTHDEAAILYACALRIKGNWLDIGCHTGWTSAHIAEAGAEVVAVDNMLPVLEFYARFAENVDPYLEDGRIEPFAGRSDQLFEACDKRILSGACIDGDHGRPNPLNDAKGCVDRMLDTGVIMLHDFAGAPVWEAVVWLMDNGFNCRVYWTPHMLACCWRGNFVPPHHERDPNVDWSAAQAVMNGFPFERCV